jgi:hypothetical protein
MGADGIILKSIYISVNPEFDSNSNMWFGANFSRRSSADNSANSIQPHQLVCQNVQPGDVPGSSRLPVTGKRNIYGIYQIGEV